MILIKKFRVLHSPEFPNNPECGYISEVLNVHQHDFHAITIPQTYQNKNLYYHSSTDTREAKESKPRITDAEMKFTRQTLKRIEMHH